MRLNSTSIKECAALITFVLSKIWYQTVVMCTKNKTTITQGRSMIIPLILTDQHSLSTKSQFLGGDILSIISSFHFVRWNWILMLSSWWENSTWWENNFIHGHQQFLFSHLLHFSKDCNRICLSKRLVTITITYKEKNSNTNGRNKTSIALQGCKIKETLPC